MRLSKEELQKRIEDNNCKFSMSWSKMSNFRTDPYGFYLKTLCRIPEEKTNSYAFLGNIVHNGLEQFYNDEINRDKMIEQFEQGVVEQSLSATNFVKDADKNKTIEDNYHTCILHFLKNYEKIDKSKLEIFVGMPFGEYYFQGYIDHIYPYKDESGDYIVVEDFKTSTLYSGKKIEENSGQLKLYAYMLSKTLNIPLSKIKIGWNFLKYVNADIEQKNGNIKTSKILRNDLSNGLEVKFKMWCSAEGFSSEETDNFFDILKKNESEYKDYNLFDGIPESISKHFKLYDCFIGADCSEDIVEEFIKGVHETMEDMTMRIDKYKITKDENIFWTTIDKSNSFYFTNLCGYTAKNHKPLREYYMSLPDYKAVSYDDNGNLNKANDKIDDDILQFLFGQDDEEE